MNTYDEKIKCLECKVRLLEEIIEEMNICSGKVDYMDEYLNDHFDSYKLPRKYK